jgi:transaldolase
MEIWLDTSHVKLVAKENSLGIIEGVTTNPTIISASSLPPDELIQELLEAQRGWLAVQVLAEDAKRIYEEAKDLHELSPRILVKIPVTREGLRAIHALNKEKVPTLATAIFEARQALLAFKAGARYLAVYLGKIADTGKNPFESLHDIHTMKEHYNFSGKIMGAGIRDLNMAMGCVKMGICAITLPDKVYEELTRDYPPTLLALKDFAESWSKLGGGIVNSQ